MDKSHQLIVEQIPHLRRYARALLRDKIEADDLVQDCLTRAMDRLHLWKPGTNIKAWLFTILHNQHINQAKRRTNRPDSIAIEAVHENLNQSPPDQEFGITVRDINHALDELPNDQRQIILLIGLEGLDYQEAAEILDIPLGTVMSRLNRGRKKMRALMEHKDAPTLRRVK